MLRILISQILSGIPLSFLLSYLGCAGFWENLFCFYLITGIADVYILLILGLANKLAQMDECNDDNY